MEIEDDGKLKPPVNINSSRIIRPIAIEFRLVVLLVDRVFMVNIVNIWYLGISRRDLLLINSTCKSKSEPLVLKFFIGFIYWMYGFLSLPKICLLYTSPSPRDS